MTEGDVVIALLPQADGQLKHRPAVLLRKLPPFGDYLVCGVRPQLHVAVKDFDEVLDPTQADYVASGLKIGHPPGFIGDSASQQLRRQDRRDIRRTPRSPAHAAERLRATGNAHINFTPVSGEYGFLFSDWP
jgi:hypothetical protein